MNFENLPAGENVPYDINVVIQIPSHGSPVQYRVDKDSGTLIMNSFTATTMFYPCKYGFMPHIQSDHGDALNSSGKWENLEGWVWGKAARQGILDRILRYNSL